MRKAAEKIAMVTGAAGGIGLEIIRALQRDEGMEIIAVDAKDFGELNSEASAVLSNAAYYRGDVSEAHSVGYIVDRAISTFGHIDILVNSAGIIDRCPFFELSESQWDKVLAVNLKGVFLVSRAVIKVMIEKRRKGRIVSMASIAGEVGGIAVGASYAASKAGVIALTKSLAKLGGPHGITANAVSPGPVKTDMISDWSAAEIDSFISRTPLRRIGEPLDVAGAVRFLVSDECSFITGQVIRVNGGIYV